MLLLIIIMLYAALAAYSCSLLFKLLFLLCSLIAALCSMLLLRLCPALGLAAYGSYALILLAPLLLLPELCSCSSSTFNGTQLLFALPLPIGSIALVACSDSLSMLLVALSALMLPSLLYSCLLASRLLLYALLICSSALIIASFLAADMLFFFVLFEAALLPLLVMLLLYGSSNKLLASLRLVLYTMLGSVAFLIALLSIAASSGSFNIAALAYVPIAPALQKLL